MKIAVYGATGQIGSRIVAEAASRGHEVTALSRRAPSADLPDGASWAAGDATDTDAVAKVAVEHDVVVAAHGPSRVAGGDPSAFTGEFADFAAAIGASRLVIVGGAGSLVVAEGVRLVDTPEFPEIYKAEALAHAAVLDNLQAGDQPNWTYLSPSPVIAPGARTGNHVLGTDSPAGGSVTIDDFAVALVDEIEAPVHVNRRFTVASA